MPKKKLPIDLAAAEAKLKERRKALRKEIEKLDDTIEEFEALRNAAQEAYDNLDSAISYIGDAADALRTVA